MARRREKKHTVARTLGYSGPAQTVDIPVTMADTATEVHITSDGEQRVLSPEDDRADFFLRRRRPAA